MQRAALRLFLAVGGARVLTRAVCVLCCGRSDDPGLLPLDRWVINTEAHPLPIWGSAEDLALLRAVGVAPSI